MTAARLRALVDAAARIAQRARRPGDALVTELVGTTGLSAEGVRLALERHLEVDTTDQQLAALIARATPAREVHVILSANVFTAALRAVVLARAAAPRVVVRPSSREPVFARALVEAAGDPAIVVIDDVALEGVREGGEVHVYGRDATIADVRARVAPGVRVRGHGAGMGAAIVMEAAELGAAASALVDDMVAFDQRGCLSPRATFVMGGADRAAAFAERLREALDARAATIPIGALSSEERAAARVWEDTMAFAGEVSRGAGGAVGLADRLVLPPPGRNMVVMAASEPAAIAVALAPVARAVVTVGLAPDAANVSRDLDALLPPHARITDLGAMQRPPLDGPVDRRPT